MLEEIQRRNLQVTVSLVATLIEVSEMQSCQVTTPDRLISAVPWQKHQFGNTG